MWRLGVCLSCGGGGGEDDDFGRDGSSDPPCTSRRLTTLEPSESEEDVCRTGAQRAILGRQRTIHGRYLLGVYSTLNFPPLLREDSDNEQPAVPTEDRKALGLKCI